MDSTTIWLNSKSENSFLQKYFYLYFYLLAGLDIYLWKNVFSAQKIGTAL